MSLTNTVEGFYGSGHTPCTVYVYTERNGGQWYAVEDSVNVNFTWDDVEDGVDVEVLYDCDFFTAGVPIDNEETLAEQVEG